MADNLHHRLQTAVDGLLAQADEYTAALSRYEIPAWKQYETAQLTTLASINDVLARVCSVSQSKGSDYFVEVETRCKALVSACVAWHNRTKEFRDGFGMSRSRCNKRLADGMDAGLAHNLYVREVDGWVHALANAGPHNAVMEAMADVLRMLPMEEPTPPPSKKKANSADIAARLDQLRLQGEKWTSYQEMADRLGCKSKQTVHAAVQSSPNLSAWAKRQAAPRAQQGLTPYVLDHAKEKGSSPEDEARINEYLQREDLPQQDRGLFNALPNDEEKINYLDLLELRKEQDKDRRSQKAFARP